jgi:hypothetical protein
MRARAMVIGLCVVTGLLVAAPVSPAAAARPNVSPGKIRLATLSQGARAWWAGRPSATARSGAAKPAVSFGSNVDANDPSKDLAAGQSETAIGAAGMRVMAAWNDISGALVLPTTDVRASVTGVGFSANGARRFTDLIGLPNNRPNQQWFGDPTVVAVDGGKAFIVGSLYYPAFNIDCTQPAAFDLAVSVASVSSTGAVSFTQPIVAVAGGNLCDLFSPNPPPPDFAQPDKDWLSYDAKTRTLAMSYTRFFFGFGGQSGLGQIEVVRAHVPANPATLSSAAFSAPIVVWPEEPTDVNTGAYVSLAPGGDAEVAWERNWNSNLFNGDPYVYIHAARVPAGASSPSVGGPASPVVVTKGQTNSSPQGGVKSLGAVVIAGYSRGIGNDFPRIAVDAPLGRVVVEWNDASLHPLGDIFLRGFSLGLGSPTPIRKVNDDNSFALHFLPAVSVRANGAIASSWYDRRLHGPDSSTTDYFSEVRATPTATGSDRRVTTGATDWVNTSSLIDPNFGDYTDNTSTGSTTYFTWSDGRIGVPQPFVDSR